MKKFVASGSGFGSCREGPRPLHVARLVIGLGVLLLASISAQVYAQTLTTLASFNSISENPYASVTLSGNTLYGTTDSGGVNNDGTVFSVPISGGSPTLLASFNGSNGVDPAAGLTLSGNTLYGTTESGGAHNDGAVFSVPLSGGSPTLLASFNGSNGVDPAAGLTLSGNLLYGTTVYGGPNWSGLPYSGDGTVFSVPLSGGSATVLASFNGSNGANATACLTLSSNTLYGTTYGGGANGGGTVFSLPASGGSPTVLASFSNGYSPVAGLTLIGNTLYGSTTGGGANADGTVFSVPLNGGSPTVLASFNGSNGKDPQAGLTLSGNTLYGTTEEGGVYGYGTVFSVPQSGGNPMVLASFNGSNGEYPIAGLTLTGSSLYGTTVQGGANGTGTVFALNIAPATIALSSSTSATIISGGTGMLGATLRDLPSSGNGVNYSVTATVQTGNATLGSVASGTLAPGQSESCTISATSTTLGNNTISFAVSAPLRSVAPRRPRERSLFSTMLRRPLPTAARC